MIRLPPKEINFGQIHFDVRSENALGLQSFRQSLLNSKVATPYWNSPPRHYFQLTEKQIKIRHILHDPTAHLKACFRTRTTWILIKSPHFLILRQFQLCQRPNKANKTQKYQTFGELRRPSRIINKSKL